MTTNENNADGSREYVVYVRGPAVPGLRLVLRLPMERGAQLAALDALYPPGEYFRSFERELPSRVRLTCAHADTCLPDYWGGHHSPHVAVPVSRSMSFRGLRDALHAEIRAGAFAGADATPDKTENAEWLAAAHAAVNRDVIPAKKGARYPFRDLEPDTDEDGPSVYAYFVFMPRED